MQSNLGNRKSNSESERFRQEGNKCYKAGKFLEALLKYNQSLCYAEDDSNRASAYVNRSAVYFELKFHQQCQNNIQLARKHNYLAEKTNVLDDREKRCLDLMMEGIKICDDPYDFFKLSYSANPKIPFIIDGVEIKAYKKFGRGIYAKQSLKVGDIISIETPFFSAFELGTKLEYFKFCSFCLKDNLMDLIPCHDCNTTMYCSENCAKSDSYHHQTVCKVSKGFETSLACNIIKRSYNKALAIASESSEDLEKLYNESQQIPS
jgi:tetratricopeptide (TPR) repeat protein